MKAIRRRTHLFAAFTGLGIALSVSISACGQLSAEIQTQLFLAVSALASGGTYYRLSR